MPLRAGARGGVGAQLRHLQLRDGHLLQRQDGGHGQEERQERLNELEKHIRRKKPLLSQISQHDDFFSGIHRSLSFQPRHSGHSALKQGRRNRSFSRLHHLRRRPQALLNAQPQSFISILLLIGCDHIPPRL